MLFYFEILTLCRSTGLAANLTSPTNEFSTPITTSTPKEPEEKKDEPKGSIVGLRSSKFTNLEKKATPSPEAKPRTIPSTEDTTPPHFAGPKPKPLPKPRPWSIVGVDRKSGEVTSVDSDKNSTEKPKSVRDMINNMNKEGDGKKKGSSLPRGTQPPTNENSANSPKTGKKNDSTSDDPRILKLEDDYAYEGVMDV